MSQADEPEASLPPTGDPPAAVPPMPESKEEAPDHPIPAENLNTNNCESVEVGAGGETGKESTGGAPGDGEPNFEGTEQADYDIMADTKAVARPKGRASKKRRASADDDEDESAYSESEESAYDESSDSVESVQSEEYDSASDEDYSDGDEYGRPLRNRGRNGPAYPMNYGQNYGPQNGNYYNQWANPMMMAGQPGMRPMMPLRPMLAPRPLPPLVNAAMPTVMQAMNSQGGARPTLTAAQLHEIARSTVASLLAGSNGPAAVPAPVPQAPKQEGDKPAEGAAEDTGKEKVTDSATGGPADGATDKAEGTDGDKPKEAEEIKATVSDEIKQNLTRMLTDPAYKAALMQRLYMNQMAKIAAAGGAQPGQVPLMPNPAQMMMMRPPMMPMMPGAMPGNYMRPPMGHPGMYGPPRPVRPPTSHKKKKEPRVRQPMKYDGADGDAPIASRRATRSAAKKVDFSQMYKEEEEVDTEINRFAEEQDNSSDGEEKSHAHKQGHDQMGTKIRIPVSRQLDDLSEIQPEIKSSKKGRKSKQASEDDEDEPFREPDYEGDELASPTDSDGEPTINKILSHRINADGEEEFLVKFTGLSYLHIEWISKEEMMEAKMGGMRIKKFMSKPLSMHHYDDRNVFNPDYVQVDRILYGWDHPTIEDPKKWTSSYLVKWKTLPYEECTWEKKEALEERVPNLADKIAEWQARPTLESRRDPHQLKIGHRPDKSAWQAMPESPVYKNENTLRSYQLEGVNWLVYCWINKQSCIIADEMGLGKTVQSVAFIQLLKEKFRVPGPFLIVAPLSTIPHWEREFQAWTDLNVLVYHGTVKSRDTMHEYEFYYKDDQDRIIPNVYRFDVLITTYEMALAGFDALQPIIWRAGIFDEAHRLKNRGSKAAEVLSLFRLEHKVMLTGTPLQNNLEELFALLHFLQPQRFASEEDFIEEYGNLTRSEDVQRLQHLLRPLMLRRLKEDVEKSIPVKEETVIEVELTSLQKRYYRAILEKNFAFLTKGCKGNNAPNLVNTMMELRKCCIHPYLIKGSEDRIVQECHAQTPDDVMNCMIQASGKLVLVDKLLKRLREQGHKVLIFSQMTRCLDLLTDYLAYRGYPFERIDGAVKGEDRQAAIDRYCDPKSDSFVFLLCTRAGGVGINLTVADTVVIYDSDWNPQNDLQAQARCHRIGQEKSVKVYRLITRNTYEREMFDKAGLKLGLDKAILQRMNNLDEESGGTAGLVGTHAPQLSKKEVETLLKKGAYGVLMDNDDDSQRFCDEDIDQILSRRTQVIRHGGAVEGDGPKETSLFSKATFAATADDYDIDLDDPNFWELWAKRLNMNPREMLSGSGQSFDEPRIRRQAKRLKDNDLLDIVMTYSGEDEMDVAPGNASEVSLWSTKERNELLDLLLKYGPNRLDKIMTAFEGRRTRNDLVACIRALIKYCLEHYDEDQFGTDRNLREDCEKLLLSNLDFEKDSAVVDNSTGKIDLLAATELEGRASPSPSSVDELKKTDRPYPNASRQQTTEFTSFLKGAPEGWLSALKAIAYPAVLRMQLVDFLRDVVESNGEGSLPVPPLPGATPAEGWGRKDDQAILLSAYNHGYGAWYDELVGDDGEKAKKIAADLGDVSTRFVKLVMAIVKRSQAAAKLALHQASAVKTRRGRRTVDEEGSGTEDDDDDEEFEAPEEEGRPRRGRRSGPKTSEPPKPTTKLTSVYWSRRDQQEFVKVVRGYGLPPKEADGDRDWTVFSQLGDFSASVLRSQTGFDEFAEIFLAACEESAHSRARRRRRTKKEMEESSAPGRRGVDEDDDRLPGELLAADEVGAEEDEDDDEEEGPSVNPEESDDEFKAPAGTKSLTIAPLLSPTRARHLLEIISLLDTIRSPAFLSLPLESLLTRARRLQILPRWWKAGTHDAAMLRAVAKYGFERDDLIIADKSLPFYSAFKELDKIRPLSAKSLRDAANAEGKPETYASGRKRRSTRAEMSAKFRPDTLPKLEGEEAVRSDGDWPTLENFIGRVKKMYDMATGTPSTDDTATATGEDASSSGKLKGRKAPVKRKRTDSEDVPTGESPKKRRNNKKTQAEPVLDME